MTLRIGILGAAAIAPSALIEPAAELDGVTVAAIAARDRGRAEAFAAEHHIPAVEADYRALCHSDLVDAVYVALPASHHKPWSIEAMRAGKDVLCEKPVALNAGEAADMVAVADETGRLMMEAFHWRYHPMADRMKELIDTRIGELQSIAAGFTVPIADRGDIRYDLSLGGGAMMDLGCYPLQWVRHVAGGEPTVTGATAQQDPQGIDVSLTAELRFDHRGGLPAEIHCSMAAEGDLTFALTAEGRDGTVVVTNPLAPHAGNRIEVTTAEGTEVEKIRSASTYYHQLVAFADAVGSGIAPPTGGADSIATMTAIDACYRAAGMTPRGLERS